MKNTIVGVDLAKKVIQVCKTINRTVRSNEEMTPDEFILFLANSKPMTVVHILMHRDHLIPSKPIT